MAQFKIFVVVTVLNVTGPMLIGLFCMVAPYCFLLGEYMESTILGIDAITLGGVIAMILVAAIWR